MLDLLQRAATCYTLIGLTVQDSLGLLESGGRDFKLGIAQSTSVQQSDLWKIASSRSKPVFTTKQEWLITIAWKQWEPGRRKISCWCHHVFTTCMITFCFQTELSVSQGDCLPSVSVFMFPEFNKPLSLPQSLHAVTEKKNRPCVKILLHLDLIQISKSQCCNFKQAVSSGGHTHGLLWEGTGKLRLGRKKMVVVQKRGGKSEMF